MAKQPRDLEIKVKIIEGLVNAMFKYPEERIGQLIQNCISFHERQTCNDIFYVEDRHILEAINARLEL